MSGEVSVDYAAVAKLMVRQELPAGWRWVASSPAARVATAQGVFIKLFLPRNLWEWPKQILRGGRATRAAREARRLENLGFLTPQVCGHGTLGVVQWLATRAVPAISFGDFVTGFFCGQPTREGIARAPLYQQLGTLVGRLHRAGVVHGDLRPNNVLLECENGVVRFYLIDNERNCQYRRIPDKLVVKNLVQIQMQFDTDFSAAERALFFAAYGKARGVDDQSCRALAATSQRRVAERLQGRVRDDLVQSRLTAAQWDFLVRELRQSVSLEQD